MSKNKKERQKALELVGMFGKCLSVWTANELIAEYQNEIYCKATHYDLDMWHKRLNFWKNVIEEINDVKLK
tara:strand:+ start:208 stop:420 length:213 start_codon:yes stop_codon:yes gene_type:complete